MLRLQVSNNCTVQLATVIVCKSKLLVAKCKRKVTSLPQIVFPACNFRHPVWNRSNDHSHVIQNNCKKARQCLLQSEERNSPGSTAMKREKQCTIFSFEFLDDYLNNGRISPVLEVALYINISLHRFVGRQWTF